MRWRKGEPVYAILTEERNTEKVCAGKQRKQRSFSSATRATLTICVREGQVLRFLLMNAGSDGKWRKSASMHLFLKATSRYFVASRRMLKVLSRQTSSA